MSFGVQFSTGTGMARIILIVASFASVGFVPVCYAEVDFRKEVVPLLAQHCLGCHNPNDRKGEFDLSTPEGLAKGSSNGEVIVAGKPEESRIWEVIDTDQMPPKKPLSKTERELIHRWVSEGGKWSGGKIDLFEFTTSQRAGYDFWSLQPVNSVTPPEVAHGHQVRNPIDRFVLEKLEKENLALSPEADPRTLIRRLSHTLRGLPPTYEEVRDFLLDSSPDAYEKLVDRYLASPEYGERWARHWLDIVRFGESQGFERDKLRTTSWRYRDWVIHSLNEDLPYDEFARQQLAGDVLYPDDPLAVVATGFLVAAPWDEVGQSQLSATMRAVVREDEMEDVIGVTCQTFLGMTVNCSRCHDHKFDPVSQKEYYQLEAALAGIRHGERESLSKEGRIKGEKRLSSLREQISKIDQELNRLTEEARVQVFAKRKSRPRTPPPSPIARWEFEGDLKDSLGGLHGEAHGEARVETGKLILPGGSSYVSTSPLERDLTEKTLEVWVRLPSLTQRGGGVLSLQTLHGELFDSIVYGEREEGKWLAGSEGFSRTQDLMGAPSEKEANDRFVQIAIVYEKDQRITVYRDGVPYGESYIAPAIRTFEKGKSNILFGLRHNPPGGDRILEGEIDRAQLYDRALSPSEVAHSAGTIEYPVSEDELFTEIARESRSLYDRLIRDRSKLELELQLRSGGIAYAVTPREPGPTYLLARGNPATPTEQVSPASLNCFRGLSGDLKLEPASSEGDRRAQLARWMTSPDQPLFSRVIVNRLWQFHFGIGLVDTPNDFGFSGTRPTHPELLDWLAGELVRNQFRLKSIHREILLSATFRQSSLINDKAHHLDAENRWLWRYSPRRLEAEAIRDSMIAIAGEMNPRMGGPGYQDFTTFTQNSQFYQIQDREGREYHRRSIYRTWVRSGRNPFLDVLDCPDPSTTSPRRANTTTPLQALSMLNNSFVLRMGKKVEEKLVREFSRNIEEQIVRAYQTIYLRSPDAEELEQGIQVVREHGLIVMIRAMLNSNEFLHID